MNSNLIIGNVLLKNVSQIEINESVDELSNTAKIVIPHNYGKLDGKSILENFVVGSVVEIKLGYNGEYNTEFKGYIREIETNYPVVIHCDDESFVLRRSNFTLSYKNATLKDVLKDIIPKDIEINCPDITLGKFQVDKESAFQVLQRIKTSFGFYSRVKNNVLYVNLRDLANARDIKDVHRYSLSSGTINGGGIKKNDLIFKRKEDYKLKVVVASVQSKGKKITIEIGSTDKDASTINVSYPGNHTESELRKFGQQIYLKRCYDGYTGSVTGFGSPHTHAGDVLEIVDRDEPDRAGRYFIEGVNITYNEDKGFSRENKLSYKVN